MGFRRHVQALVVGGLLFATARGEAGGPRREVSGWYNDGWNAESHATYLANKAAFTEINPYWYDLGSAAHPTATDGSIEERGYAFTPSNVVDAHASGALVVPAIADRGPGQIDRLVASETSRRRLIENLVAVARTRSYDGIDLNFERGTPAARARFAKFVTSLAAALHAEGKRLEVTVPAATSRSEELAMMFDYAALAASGADRIKLMAYDHNFDVGTAKPSPIAPIPWVRRALDYAIGKRRVPPSMIRLGVHNYGWTWRKSGSSWQMLFPHDTFQNVEQNARATPWRWNESAAEPWKEYTVQASTYRSYVGTADAVLPRVALAAEYDLAGVAFWVLGREDASVYPRVCAELGGCEGASFLLSQGKPVTSSSSFDGYYTAEKATDGSIDEGWLAAPEEEASWLSVDLAAERELTEVRIYWGGYDWPTSYDIQTSVDGRTWTTAYHEPDNDDGGLDTITLRGVTGRHLRVLCNGAKSDGWSFEIYELEVFGLAR